MRLVRIDATRIADPSLELPSLEAFAEARGLEDERQADQIAAYEAAYASNQGRATQRLRRRARLIARQLEALRWLESLVAQSPEAGDAVAAWLNPTLASHLEAADIFTLAHLVERINGVGRRWHAGIKAMGEGKALRVVEWLQNLANTDQASIDLQLGRHVAMPRSKLYAHELQAVVAPATAIRPLEKFIVPVELDGTRGLYRRPQAQCLLKATNDYQAILAWLRSKHGLTPDQKAHRKARWRQRRIEHDTGVEQTYLMGNPWSAVGVPRTAGPKVNAGRSFSLAQWQFIETQLTMLPATSANQRLTFGLHLLYATGLRLSEVVAATVDDLQWVEYPADASDDEPLQGWLLRVVGKGQKEREVPVSADVVGELARYLESRGLDPDPEDIGNQGAFLLGKASDAAARAPGLNTGQLLDPREGIAATTFYDQIKAFFTGCADVLRGQGEMKGADRFAKASTHWMRHSHASHAIAGGMPIEIAQQNLGHASLATTTVYVTTEKRRRMKAVEAFWRR